MPSFEDTVKNLLNMKPQPHEKKAEADEKKGDEADRRPPASGSSDEGH